MSCSLWPQKSQLEGYEVMQVLYIFAYKDIFDIFDKMKRQIEWICI